MKQTVDLNGEYYKHYKQNINFIADEIIEEIGTINGIQVQRQFGNNKIAALNLRITIRG
jgi:hypothetical protein